MTNAQTLPNTLPPGDAANTADNTPVSGRSLFAVETTVAGVAVQTVFLTDDQRLLHAPAVFPDIGYALAQIDELRAMVMQHFTRAAQVGAQVLAAQAQAAAQTSTSAADQDADKEAAAGQAGDTSKATS